MAVKNLVIVESPGKIKTISKYLGGDYTVLASMGHVRDLPKSTMGIEIENNFEPKYEITKDKQKVVKDLKAKVGNGTTVWIATDEDREGEAIGWHLVEALKLKKGDHLKRIVFHEITKPAILEAMDHPRSIDMNLVNSQQARRVLDRIVGYELSPLLWKKIKPGLSAGRVQSVAVRMICEREAEINAFVPEEYWSIIGQFKKGKDEFDAKLAKYKGKGIKIGDEKGAKKVLSDLKGASYEVVEVERKEVLRNPAPPFTTSTLQQEAARKLGFSVKKTMMVAQKLYEGVELKSGHEGLITYMRTDSVNLSALALKQAAELVEEHFGKEYALESPRYYKGRKGAQEAHEAIRPTDLSRFPETIKDYLDKDAYRLYELIWKRTLACQMAPAVLNKVGADIEANSYTFRATGQTIKFPGFMKVYLEDHDEDDADEENDGDEKALPELAKGDKPDLKKLVPNQHFTKPPPRYTEASLVKKLESEGIGRPSTYAPTISTVQTRGYVEKDGNQLKPTDMGNIVNDFLVEHFPKVVDYQFTARMEDMLDEVEEGKEKWQEEVEDFYVPFNKLIKSKEKTVSREEASQVRELGMDAKTGKMVSVRIGRYGPFVQLGTKDDKDKPKFASLPAEMDRESVEMKDVMYLFKLPRSLGKTRTGEEVMANIGRFGPYVQVGKEYFSIKDDDPYSIDLKRALEVISDERKRKAKAVIADFSDEDIKVLDGRYGPYIKHANNNYKIPKTLDAEKLSLDDCKKIIEDAGKKK